MISSFPHHTAAGLRHGWIAMQGAAQTGRCEGGSMLPVELTLAILALSASSHSTAHARNICLVSRAVYNHCWPCLHRIVGLRNARELKAFSEEIHQPACTPGDARENARLKIRQDSLRFLYLNNNKDTMGIKELQTDERPDMWMMSILLAAKNLEVMHVEEYWSISYPWESQEEKPLLAYPLMLLSNFPTALHAAVAASPNSQWVRRLFADRQTPSADIVQDIERLQCAQSERGWTLPRLREVTLSALAMSTNHLDPSLQQSSPSSTPDGNDAFGQLTRLHLYFAKMDPLLVGILTGFPRLTHLRLTRPFSENLSDAVFRLLGGETGRSQVVCLIVEAGIYMDQRTLVKLRELQSSPLGRGRLRFIDNLMFQHGPYKPPEIETLEGSDERSSSSSHVINWVTSSEERGFSHFAQRATGSEGVWSVR